MKKENCTGVIFRGFQSQFFDRKSMSFNYKEGFRLLKRDSCKCIECKDIVKSFESDGNEMVDCTYWFKTFNHEPIENGSKFRLKVVQWESDFDECSGESWAYPTDVKMELIK